MNRPLPLSYDASGLPVEAEPGQVPDVVTAYFDRILLRIANGEPAERPSDFSPGFPCAREGCTHLSRILGWLCPVCRPEEAPDDN